MVRIGINYKHRFDPKKKKKTYLTEQALTHEQTRTYI